MINYKICKCVFRGHEDCYNILSSSGIIVKAICLCLPIFSFHSGVTYILCVYLKFETCCIDWRKKFLKFTQI